MGERILKIDWRGRFFRYAPLLFFIALVLFTSSSQASLSKTSRFLGPFLEFIFPNAPEQTIYFYHVLIRKLAHFAQYGLMGFLAARAFWNSGRTYLSEKWYLNALTLVLVVASIDELNQYFNPTRTGLLSDVILDVVSGALVVGIMFVYKRGRNN